MKFFKLFVPVVVFLKVCRSWEYCQKDIQKELCGAKMHFVCDLKTQIQEVGISTSKSKKFLAHVPLTRQVKTSFLNWHNYYRNRTAGGWVKNKQKAYFPTAVRMRELIWDSELSYLSHVRTKMVSNDSISCSATQRFPFVGQNLIIKAFNETQPVLEIISSSLKKMFNKKNLVDDPKKMPNEFLDSHWKATQFIIMVNDRISRLGCAVALGADCTEKGNFYKYCYYTACTYDEANKNVNYKIGKPTGRCSRWEVGRSKTYLNLCANSGKIFKRDN